MRPRMALIRNVKSEVLMEPFAVRRVIEIEGETRDIVRHISKLSKEAGDEAVDAIPFRQRRCAVSNHAHPRRFEDFEFLASSVLLLGHSDLISEGPTVFI